MSETDLVDSTSATESPALTDGADVGEVDEDDVAEGVLGVVGDADPDPAAVGAEPLVVGRVPEVVGHVHGRGGYPDRPTVVDVSTFTSG